MAGNTVNIYDRVGLFDELGGVPTIQLSINKSPSNNNDSTIHINNILSLITNLINTITGPRMKKDGKNILAAKCDQLRVSPLNVYLSITNPTKQ